jgi:small subunit ribosomal protein S19
MARSVWKGPFVERSLLKKVEDFKNGKIKGIVKTWSRRSTILPQMVGITFGVHNGKTIHSRSGDRPDDRPQTG